jgi:mRNA interferase YafQ
VKYQVTGTHRFKKSLKKIMKSGRFDLVKYNKVINNLADGQVLSHTFHDHQLQGDFSGQRECHIESDILLIYYINEEFGVLSLSDIGSHAYLFG